MTANLLFLSKQEPPNLQQGVAFLTTRVKNTDRDDYTKLGRVFKYLRADPHLPLTLESNITRILKWRIDASFTVHPDMKSHTGGNGSLVKGESTQPQPYRSRIQKNHGS